MASSINTVSTGGRNYMSGLASGMDTESIVESLLSGTQSKIDKQTGVKQQLEWKQDIYRKLITNINSFSDKYFSYYGSENTNLLSNSLYNTMTGVSSSSAVKVNSVASNAVKGMTIDAVKQLATACTVRSGDTVTGDAVGKDADLGKFSDSTKTYAFSITLDGVNKVISFAGVDGADTDPTKQKEVLDHINQALYRNFGTSVGMNVDADGKMELVQLSADPITGKPDIAKDTNGAVIPVESSRRVIIESVAGNPDTINYLGFEGGFSNKLAYGMALKDMNFKTELQGGRYEFEINGVKISGLTGDSTLSEVISAINNSGAGVSVSYSSAADKFIMQSSSTGEISNISMSQTYGNLLTTMFGVEAAGVQSSLLSREMKTAQATSPDDGLAGLDQIQQSLYSGEDAVFTFVMDNQEVSVTLEGRKESTTYKTREGVVAAINAQLNKKFGTGAVVLKMTEDTDDPANSSLSLISEEHKIELKADDMGAFATLGFSAGTNLLSGTDKLADYGFTGDLEDGAGNTFSVGADTTVDQLKDFLVSAFGTSVDFTDGRMNVASLNGKKLTGTLSGTLFGTENLDFSSVTASAASTTPGQNSIITVDGTDVVRNTNTYEIDGITIELTAKSDTAISLTTSRDTDKIVDSLKGFVEDYNKLIEELNGYLNEENTSKKYPPLTDAQKKEMSDREIELWEEKSKQGLLRNDSNISSLLSDMRMTLYNSVESAGLALYDIGIETSNNWKENGKLVIDEDTLRNAVVSNADSICKLFTDKEQGVAVKLQEVIKAAANASSASPGSMVRYAGTKDVLVTSNTLYQEMKNITQTLSKLNTKYTQERERYWKQFTAMEHAISNLNSHSSWLSQQFSS